MSRIVTFFCAALILAVASVSTAASKSGKAVKLTDSSAKTLRAASSLSAADTCIVRQDKGIKWRIDGWIIGNELYKSYLDPSQSTSPGCALPYPFTIYEINMLMAFDAATPLIVSVDIEMADTTVPNCPVPGQLLAISAQYQYNVTAAGLYNVWVPLDSPITVTGPFFAGFFIGDTFAAGVNPGLITDSVPTTCVSYNIWDTTIGYVDLDTINIPTPTGIFTFPGRLVLYARGFPGGQGGTQPPPSLTLISPPAVDTLFGSANLWAWENSGSTIIDHVVFESQPSGGSFTEIGRDFDGAKTNRDGVNNAVTADGYSFLWNFSANQEGIYTIRATAFDTSGRTSADSSEVYLEPTPPLPGIVSPTNGASFCPSVQLVMNLFDENFTQVDAYVKEADTLFTLNLLQLNQANYGDINGNALDGNHRANGEFGDYYSGPVAVTQALRVWYDRNYRQFMRNGLQDIPINTFVEMMAANFATRANHGTYDENLIQALHQHLDRFGITTIDFQRAPGYFNVRAWVEEEERAVILGLSGNPGLWVAVDGFSGWNNVNGEFLIRIGNPLTGLVEPCLMRNLVGGSEIQIAGVWHSVDIMISIMVNNWNVARQLIGSDNNGTNGWTINWTTSGLHDNYPSFFRAAGIDDSGFSCSSTILMNYSCASYFVKGDYNGDNASNLQDLVYIIDFVLNSGPPPMGGTGRADANCDNNVNITDVVYFMNFMFGSAGAPCY